MVRTMTYEERREKWREFIKKFYPEIPDDKIDNAAENLERYLEVVWRIAERKRQDGDKGMDKKESETNIAN